LPELLLTPSQPTAKLQQFSAQPQTTRWQLTTDATQEVSTTALARALADSINISRLPVPEPAVFNGDPLNYFLLGTDAAYYAAWDTLKERYGGSFVIAKAFRDKLTSWPKIGTKDSAELREWNRKVIEVEEQHGCFPTFSNFVDFITREAKIACNPVTSLHALKG
ncbi:hypothetical protein M9458_006134, partial [Cirrhinus mrigala]